MKGTISLKVRDAFPSIEEISIELLINTYRVVCSKNEYSLDWEEEQFSSLIVAEMNKQDLTRDWHLHVDIEYKLLNEDKLPLGKNNPKYLPRIDIVLASWLFEEGKKVKYFFEAKNLYENNYKQKLSSQYLNRYIKTGIEYFRTGKYHNGSLVGYILDGEVSHIVNKLNIQLKKNRKDYKSLNCLSTLEKIDFMQFCSMCYKSAHYKNSSTIVSINHIFLKL